MEPASESRVNEARRDPALTEKRERDQTPGGTAEQEADCRSIGQIEEGRASAER